MNLIEERLDAMLNEFENDKENNGIISNSILAVLRYVKMGNIKVTRDELKYADRHYWEKIKQQNPNEVKQE